MECIVIGTRVYRASHNNLDVIKVVMGDWVKLINDAINTNYNNYKMKYRKALGIPLDATIEEEATYIHETYGEKPYKNQEFVDKLSSALCYERTKIPDFVSWLKERGIEASVELNVFMIDEEADYG